MGSISKQSLSNAVRSLLDELNNSNHPIVKNPMSGDEHLKNVDKGMIAYFWQSKTESNSYVISYIDLNGNSLIKINYNQTSNKSLLLLRCSEPINNYNKSFSNYENVYFHAKTISGDLSAVKLELEKLVQ